MTSKNIKVVKFFPQETSSKTWNSFHAFQDAIFLETNPDDPLPAHSTREKQMILQVNSPLTSTIHQIAITDAGQVVGKASMTYPKPESPDYESQKSVVTASIEVAHTWRRQGLGTCLLKKIMDFCHAEVAHAEWIQIGSKTKAGQAFAETFGGELAIVAQENRLYMQDVNWEIVQEWEMQGQSRAPDVCIESFEGLIESDLEAFCQLYTEVANQQPFEALEGAGITYTPDSMRRDHEAAIQQGQIWTTVITHEENGAISGLTDFSYDPKRPHQIVNHLTGVKSIYRGRGLGKWLKAAALLHIRKNYPDIQYITTLNANTNAPMLSINSRLGFKLYNEKRVYKFAVKNLTTRLG